MATTVKAAMALIDLQDGTTVAVQRGGAVPDNVKPEHLEHLLAFELVEDDGEVLAGLEPTRPGDGSEPAPRRGRRKAKEDGTPEAPKPPVERPADDADLEAWQGYARSKGATDADLEGKSRDELVAAYGA